MKKTLHNVIVGIAAQLLALSWTVLPATGAELGEHLVLRGFYTLDATHSDSDGAVVPTAGDPFLLDEGDTSTRGSLVGLQADYALSSRLELTLQALSAAQKEGEYDPSLEWAYLSYDLGGDLRLRGGRMKVSLLQGTELRHVGFSRLWVRPLVPTGGAGGFEQYTGLEFIQGITTDSYTFTVQGGVGQAEHDKDFVDNRYIAHVSTRIEREDSWLNLSLLRAKYDVDTIDGRDLKDGAELSMAAMESEIHANDWVINVGLAYGEAEINPDEQMAYLSLGHRFGRATPYVLGMQRRMIFDASEFPSAAPTPPGPPPPGPPPPLAPPSPRDGTDVFDTLAVGIRYDVTATMAIKGQWDRWSVDERSRSANVGPIKRDGNLFTLTIEGVF